MSPRTEIPSKLDEAWNEAGQPAFRKIERALLPMLGDDETPSHETIRSYHRGPLPVKYDVNLLLGLTRYYGKDPGWLGPDVDRAARRLMVLVGGLSTGGPEVPAVTVGKRDQRSDLHERVAA